MNTPTIADLSPSAAAVRRLLPGLLLCTVIALAASFVAGQYGGPRFLYALLLGMAFHYLADNPRTMPGVEVSAKKLVRFGVGLLGARIAFSDVAALGVVGVGALVGAVVLTMGFGILLARLLRLPPALGLLSGGGTGICGISATLAISATLPQTPENERHTLLAAIGVAIFSTIAMVFYPLLVTVLDLSTSEAGLFLGGAIHDVAQVVGAAFMLSPEVADAATLTKMFRVAMLVPVVFMLALSLRRQAAEDAPSGAGQPGKTPQLPFFLVAFALLVAINSLGWIPDAARVAASSVSTWSLVISIVALGVKTSIAELAELGWRPIVLLGGEAVFIAVYVLAVVFAMRLFQA